jgi:tetratricopeptide repeat protein
MAPVCFVVMGFGKKTDLATGRELDLDKSYKSIIKPAVLAAGYQCIRADEVQQSGMIDVPMYRLLYEAELVIADLSTTNPNAVFELGVRHALKPRATIIIAESKFTIPFDATHIAVRRYEHLGSSIDYDEAIRMQKVLTDLIAALPGDSDPDSPVYTILPRLNPPALVEVAAPAAAGFAARAATVAGAMPDEAPSGAESYASKVQTAREAINEGAFAFARKLLLAIYKDQTAPGADGKPKPARAFVVQQLALAAYKAGEAEAKTGGPEKALAGYAEAESLLGQLDVETTTDPETLGLWSAIHKRRAETPGRTAEQQKADVDTAVDAAERGFMIKRDYYNGTNLAYLFNLRASLSSGDDRIADNVFANRVRKMVVRIIDERLAALGSQKVDPAEARPLDEERYWMTATKAESLIALGDPAGPGLMQAALASAPAGWMADTTRNQMDRLKTLLAKAKA